MYKIVFLGLAGRQSNQVLRAADEVWTLNDWYRVYPSLPRIDRVYQIHGDCSKINLPNRFNNWRVHYEQSGAEIVCVGDLGFTKQRYFNSELAEAEFGQEMFTSSLCYMFADAIWYGAHEIYLEGITLRGGEYLTQVPGVLRFIDIARCEGIRVYADQEEYWRNNIKIDYTKVQQSESMYWFEPYDLGEIKYNNSEVCYG